MCRPTVNLAHRVITTMSVLSILLLPMGTPRAASPQQQSAVKAGTATRGAAEEEEVLQVGPVSTSEKQGYGCIFAGGAGLLLSMLIGTGETVLLFTGATTLPATNPFGVGLAVVGTVVASTCAVGALVAPTAVRLWRIYDEGAKIVDKPAQR